MKKGVCRGKRGLSPVIASVLLIALVLVLASIIFMWARGFISEQIEKFGNPVELANVGNSSFFKIMFRMYHYLENWPNRNTS